MAEVADEPEHPEPRLSAPVPLSSEHDLSGFDCGEPALNDWLRHRALKNESRFSRAYVVCEGDHVHVGALVEIDPATLAIRKRWEVGVYPDGVAFGDE